MSGRSSRLASDNRVVTYGRTIIAAALLFLAEGCGLPGGSPGPTPTPNDLFTIVTPTTGSVPVPARELVIVDEYIVQPGDSLLDIAMRYGVTLNDLQLANGIANPNNLYAGQTLQIPAPEETGES
jgi:LysM repeat protein